MNWIKLLKEIITNTSISSNKKRNNAIDSLKEYYEKDICDALGGTEDTKEGDEGAGEET